MVAFAPVVKVSRFLSALLLVALASACKKKEPKAPIGVSNVSPTMYPPKKSANAPHVVGNLVASMGESSLGPYWAKRGTGPNAVGVISWLTPAEGQGRRIFTVPVDANGTLRGGESVVANVSVDTISLIVRPIRGAAPGFVATWTSLTDRGKSLWSVAIGDDGKARGKPVELTRSTDDIAWVDIIPTDKGAVILWAEETRGGDANLIGASLDTDGRVRESAVRVARGITGWHALELPHGIGVSTVTGPKINGPKGGGALSFIRLDADAHPVGAPTAVTHAPVVSGDVEVVREGSGPNARLFFAWTDRSTEEPAVSIAALDMQNGLVEGPRRVAEARGGAALLGITSGPAGVGLMFESPARRKDPAERKVHIGRVGERLYLERPLFSTDTVGKSRPEIAATSTGFAVLATAPDCEPGTNECATAATVATVFRTDSKMALIQREPLSFGSDPAGLGWSLSCEAEQCLALAASGSSPARVRMALVRPRVNAKPPAPPGTEPGAEAVARIDDITAVVTGESVVKIATAGSIVATLGAKDTKHEAVVTTRFIEGDAPATKAEVIAPRAVATGGLGIALAEKPDDGGAMVWIAKDGGDPQVHITRIDKRGRRLGDNLLTSARGEKSDVTISWAGNGYVVAWVDGRDGNGEVYATKLGPDLSRSGREERITNAPGDASDLVALAHGDRVWLAWADPRESPQDGIADVYVTALKKTDAKRAIEEQRMLSSAAHSRTPTLADSPQGPTIAWIEEAPAGSESPHGGGFGAYWARLDADGKPAVKPARMQLAGEGAATAVALEGSHAVVARSMPDAIALDGVDLGKVQSAALIALDGPPSLDVALHFAGPVLYFNDDGPDPADRRARRAKLVWTK